MLTSFGGWPVLEGEKWNDKNFDWIDDLKSNLLDEEEKRIWLTTNGNPINGVLGMIKCLKKEPKGNRIRCLLDFDDEGQNQTPMISDELVRKDLTINIVNKGQLGCIIPEPLTDLEEIKTQCKFFYLDMLIKGDLTSFRWLQAQQEDWNQIARDSLKFKSEIVYIYYSALNFRDIMLASGRISIDGYSNLCQLTPNCLGIEYSGLDETGQRIMGISHGQAIANIILIDDRFLRWKVPDNMTLEEAATIPVCYYTVYYSLIIRGKLKPGEKVLIHAGSGGVGQAAISVCLNRHCEVFTTVSTQAKRDFLKEKFPQLTDDHISNSRTTEFEEQVLKMTNGVGVDLVLNSLADDKLQASIRCLAEYGRFLEIGKYDVIMDSKLGKKRNLIMMKSL